MSTEPTDDHEDQRTRDDAGETTDPEGQLSELAMGDDEPAVISPGDAVAGSPEGESGDVQEGAAGPNAIPVDETHEHTHVGAHEDDAEQTAADADE